MWVCERCKTEVEDNLNQCWNCYDDRVLLDDIKNEVKEEEKVINKALFKEEMKYQDTKWVCKKCHEENKEHSDNCSNCGVSYGEGFSLDSSLKKIEEEKYIRESLNKYNLNITIIIIVTVFISFLLIVFFLALFSDNLFIFLSPLFPLLILPRFLKRFLVNYYRKRIISGMNQEKQLKTTKKHYSNGNLELEIIPKDGNLIYKYYHENGEIRSEVIMQEGKRLGKMRKWDEKGNELESE